MEANCLINRHAGASAVVSSQVRRSNNLGQLSESIKTAKAELGFSMLQLLITVAIIIIVAAFAFMGITKARANIRLSNSVRQFAAFAERARGDAVRRHGVTSLQQVSGTTYSVTMDFNASGTVTTQNFATEAGVLVNFPRTIVFDWRGRTPVETSVGFTNESGSSNVAITGSGDVTVDAQIFQDGWIPGITLIGSGGSVVPDPTPTPDPSASPSPQPSPSPTVTPTPDPSATPSPTPMPTPTPSPTPYPTPTPTPTATPAPTATPTPVPCSMTVSPNSISIAQNGSGTITVNLNNHSGSGTISAASDNNGQIQVAPSSATVTGESSTSFTITVKKTSGYVTFTSSCGTQSVTVNVN